MSWAVLAHLLMLARDEDAGDAHELQDRPRHALRGRVHSNGHSHSWQRDFFCLNSGGQLASVSGVYTPRRGANRSRRGVVADLRDAEEAVEEADRQKHGFLVQARLDGELHQPSDNDAPDVAVDVVQRLVHSAVTVHVTESRSQLGLRVPQVTASSTRC